MTSVVDNRSVARAAGVVGIVGHLAAATLYLLLPGLEVPYPALYGFQAAWVSVLIVSIWSFRNHPWRSVVIPIVGVIAAVVVRILGEQYLGWRG